LFSFGYNWSTWQQQANLGMFGRIYAAEHAAEKERNLHARALCFPTPQGVKIQDGQLGWTAAHLPTPKIFCKFQGQDFRAASWPVAFGGAPYSHAHFFGRQTFHAGQCYKLLLRV
jgi:hypothetical protein